jgi:hypothetical protein
VAGKPGRTKVESPFFRREEVIGLLRSEGILRRMEFAGWLTAKVRRPKYVIYLKNDVLAALARLEAGDYPEL